MKKPSRSEELEARLQRELARSARLARRNKSVLERLAHLRRELAKQAASVAQTARALDELEVELAHEPSSFVDAF